MISDEYLEEFYNDNFRVHESEPEFKDIDQEYKKAILGTLSYQKYFLARKMREITNKTLDVIGIKMN